MTDRLIHPTGWYEYLRYATHKRRPDWRPPLVSFAVAKIQQAAETLTPRQLGVFLLFVCGYAECPLIDPDAGLSSAREFVDRPATWKRRVGHNPTSVDKTAWRNAGLIEFTTVEEPLTDGQPTVSEPRELEREPEPEPEQVSEHEHKQGREGGDGRDAEREREPADGRSIESLSNRSALDSGEQGPPVEGCKECGGVHPDRPRCPLLKPVIRSIERTKKRVSPEEVNAFRIANGKKPWTWD